MQSLKGYGLIGGGLLIYGDSRGMLHMRDYGLRSDSNLTITSPASQTSACIILLALFQHQFLDDYVIVYIYSAKPFVLIVDVN